MKVTKLTLVFLASGRKYLSQQKRRRKPHHHQKQLWAQNSAQGNHRQAFQQIMNCIYRFWRGTEKFVTAVHEQEAAAATHGFYYALDACEQHSDLSETLPGGPHTLPPTTDYDYNDVNEHSYLETLPTTDELINAIMASNEFLTPHMNNTLDDFLILNSQNSCYLETFLLQHTLQKQSVNDISFERIDIYIGTGDCCSPRTLKLFSLCCTRSHYMCIVF